MQQSVGSTPKIALRFSLNLKGGRTVCRGILDYARRNGPWRCMLLEGRDNEQILSIKRLGIDGIITHNLSRDDAKVIASSRTPVIVSEPWPDMLLDPDHPLSDAPYVKMDSYGVGKLAAEYYLKRGYKSFAYVGETLGMYWSADRCKGFTDTLKAAGFDCTVYNRFSARERRSWDAERPRMMRFLGELPKPTAIFAAMDGRARLVLDACAEAGIRVPEEIAVLGVDNDPILCESTIPPLSSISTGGFQRGQKAAEMLDDLMHGRPVRKKNVVMEPLSVITRESTGYDAMRDPVIARAMRFIRSEAGHRHIDVSDVVAATGCSRRYVELRFRRHVGASIRDIILQTKLESVKTLLWQSNLSIGEITEKCGFARESHLAVVFKKSTGVSMRDYRRTHRENQDE